MSASGSPPAPDRIKHYQVKRLLGQGGMGMVFEGEDRRDGSRVAIKLLHQHLAASDPTYLDRFEREAHSAALLRSPYTAHLIDFGVEHGQAFLVMEYIDGEPLSRILNRGPIAPAEALRVAGEVSRALEEAGARGLVHRDIKPENILLDTDGRVKVIDFGIARSTAAPGLTTAGGFVGTPAFAAPEQIDGEVDQRSDIYALGVTLYAMLTGRPPFEGKSAIDTLFQHRTAPVPTGPLQAFPDSVQNIVRRCLEKDPRDRYQTAAELSGAIERGRQSVTRMSAGGTLQAVPPPPGPSSSIPPRPSSNVTGVPAPGLEYPQRPPVLQPEPVHASELQPPVAKPSRRPILFALAGSAAAVAVVAIVAVLILGDGDDSALSAPTPASSPRPVSPTTARATPTAASSASQTATAAVLPSVTPPVSTSRLSSGGGAVVRDDGVAINVWQTPSELTPDNVVLATLFAGEGVVVVTNSPPGATYRITEGLVFWRVLIPGTSTVGWVKEVGAVDGSLRYLDPARTYLTRAGDTCFSVSIGNLVDEARFQFVNQLDDSTCLALPENQLFVLPG
ncbi:MAG: serine/threonine-protein kinase [Dehalococcoidia bacterium]|nr:serine/threonine protein kinase [Dehalococcoidia bacterium]MCB9486160.1 serine/threonine protein kinase [Thermoflexaceae bacterium]